MKQSSFCINFFFLNLAIVLICKPLLFVVCSSVGLFTHHDQQNKNTQISADPYEATTETANFCRLARLILDVCNAAMRDLLQCKLSGGELILTQTLALNRKKIEHHLLDIQKKTLFPPKNGLVKYRKLDFTLMYSIVRNVCPDKIEPNSTNKYKWGKKPVPGDTSLLAAIERIRACRNEFFAHATEAKICDSEFKDLWASLEQALFKIDDNLGSASYRKEMKNIRKMQIDPELNKRLQELTEKEAMLNALIEKDGNYFYSSVLSQHYFSIFFTVKSIYTLFGKC